MPIMFVIVAEKKVSNLVTAGGGGKRYILVLGHGVSQFSGSEYTAWSARPRKAIIFRDLGEEMVDLSLLLSKPTSKLYYHVSCSYEMCMSTEW